MPLWVRGTKFLAVDLNPFYDKAKFCYFVLSMAKCDNSGFFQQLLLPATGTLVEADN